MLGGDADGQAGADVGRPDDVLAARGPRDRLAVAEPDVRERGARGLVRTRVDAQGAAEGGCAGQRRRRDEPHLGVAPDQRGGALPDLGEVVVEVTARAGGLVGVAVAVDGGQPDLAAAAVPVAALRPDADVAPRVAVERVELPRGDGCDRVEDLVGGADELEVPDHGDAGRRRVEAQRVGAAHEPPRAAGPARPDPAEPVDEEVVADVGPAQVARVVAVHPPDQRGHVTAPVVVAARRVVHVHLLDGAVVARLAVAPPLVRAPLPSAALAGPRHPSGPRERLVLGTAERYVGLVGRGGVARLRPGVQQHEGEPARPQPADAHLHAVGGPDPHQVGAGDARILVRGGVGPVGQHGHGPPVAPATIGARAYLRIGRGLPSVPGQREHRVRRGGERRGLPAAVVGATGEQRTVERYLQLTDPLGRRPGERQGAGTRLGVGAGPDAHGCADGPDGGHAPEGRLQHRSPARGRLLHHIIVGTPAPRVPADTAGSGHLLTS